MAHNLDTDRTTRLLELMKQGDDAFNRRDLEGMSAAHEADLICHMMGSDAPIRGDKPHREAMQGMMRSFPTSVLPMISIRSSSASGTGRPSLAA